MAYSKTRLTIRPNGEQTKLNFGRIDRSELEADMANERHNYAMYPSMQATEETLSSVIAVSSDGTVRITSYRLIGPSQVTKTV